ncbi:MAG: hypothetical protein NTZ95_00090 [Candidatus Omnitrophica bacterium]|nr:hypothetical protein [Candidatus Omnitrophota bacterium]
MQNKKLIALIVLGIGAVISLIYGATSTPKGRGRAAASSPTIIVTQAPAAINQTQNAPSIKRRAKRSSFPSWSRSPFVPKSVKGSSYQMELSGILGSGKNLKAMINGQILGKGDKLGSAIVTDIAPDRVTLNDGSKDIVLKLEQ